MEFMRELAQRVEEEFSKRVYDIMCKRRTNIRRVRMEKP
jgi:hypothetical protein